MCRQLKFTEQPSYNEYARLISQIGIFIEEESKVPQESFEEPFYRSGSGKRIEENKKLREVNAELQRRLEAAETENRDIKKRLNLNERNFRQSREAPV